MTGHESQDIAELQERNCATVEGMLGYTFKNKNLLKSAITHPSAIEGAPVKYSYERLEFLGDAILGCIVAAAAFKQYPDIDEGGLTRIKVSLVSGDSLTETAEALGFAKIIVFGNSETGTHGRGMHSALENVYESIVAALFLDGGMEEAKSFVDRTLIPKMDIAMAQAPTNPKSELQEILQEDGITPVYRIIETQGPPHDRTFVSQVYAGDQALASGSGRSKKEAESQAAKSTLARLSEFLGIGIGQDPKSKAKKERAQAEAKAKKQAQKAQRENENKRRQEQKARQQAAAKEAKAQREAAARQKKAKQKANKEKQPQVWESDLQKVRSNAAREAQEARWAKEAQQNPPQDRQDRNDEKGGVR